jgi:secreted Zn-dependent insulinase-like peptidase
VFKKQFLISTNAIFILVFITGCTTTQILLDDDARTLIKSPSDHRAYQSFTLPNQLDVLVISDPTADKSAASLDVKAGSGNDPVHRQGLAHFLEHMLFLGTEKFPEPVEYRRFIDAHGGSNNAYTSLEHTNYFFDIQPQFLAPALDRFAAFFISPLFNEDYVDREKQAVNAEYQSGLKSDFRRQHDVVKTLAKPDHPFSKFNVGNLETLTDDKQVPLRQDLIDFHQRYYSADKMKLVVVGQESVQQLRALVEQKFNGIPNRSGSKNKNLAASVAQSKDNQPYPDDLLPARINITPVKAVRSLRLQFPIDNPKSAYRQKPVQYIANLIGFEGPGSLLSYLKTQGWAESLSASQGFSGEGFALFELNIGLTETGLNHINEITRAVFEQIALIRSQGIEAWRFHEQARLNELAFMYEENRANIHLVSSLSRRMHDYPMHEVLSAPYQMDQFDPELIQTYLQMLTPGNLLMLVVAKELQTDQKTKWYGTPYSRLNISMEDQKLWLQPISAGALQLPAENPFIPDNLILLTPPEEQEVIPEQIFKHNGLTLWYKFDNSFGTPRANFYFTIRSTQANQSARQSVLTQLYVSMVNEKLNEFSYPAFLANLHYELYKHMRGVSIRISGYQQKQSVLLTQILKTLKDPEMNIALFDQVKQRLQRQLANTRKSPPSRQVSSKVTELLVTPSWSVVEMETALTDLTHKDLSAFVPQLFSKVEIVALANGNIDKASAQSMATSILQSFETSLTTQTVRKNKVVKLTQPKQCFNFPVTHPDSAVIVYFQGTDKTIATRATFALLNQLSSTPFFHDLRTEQQLGYIVYASPFVLLDTPGIAFVVQSPSHSNISIVNQVSRFIAGFKQQLATMDSATFNQHKQALITQILTKDTRLAQSSNRMWLEIDRENFAFDTRERLVGAIEALSLPTTQVAYWQHLAGGNARELIVSANGDAAGNPADKTESDSSACINSPIPDVKALQNSGSYF